MIAILATSSVYFIDRTTYAQLQRDDKVPEDVLSCIGVEEVVPLQHFLT